jgi:tetratricopeptide (TPR) repeat protein
VLGQTYDYLGELQKAATCFERITALDGDLRYEQFGAPSIQWGLAGAWLADVRSQLGLFEEAIGCSAAAVQVGVEAGNDWTEFRGLIDLGRVHLRRGDVPRAIQTLERSLDLSRSRQFAFGIPHAEASLAAAYGLAGRADEALALVSGPLDNLRRRNDHSRPTLVLLCAVIVYLTAGQLEEAADLAAWAVAQTRHLRAAGFLADSLRLSGDIALAAGDAHALGYYQEALTLASPRAMRPVIAQCHLGIGKLYRRDGRQAEARTELTTAVALLREMKMAYWLPAAEAELAAAIR